MKTAIKSKIVGLQFSILSPDEIRAASVVQITNRETHSNNKPVLNGLFDPRMGVIDYGAICPTDGLTNITTPGYFGHIELARPMFYIQYLNTVINVLKCICLKCSKLLIDKNKHSHALNMSSEFRHKYVLNLVVSKIKKCGDDTCNGCMFIRPTKIKKEGLGSIQCTWESGEVQQYSPEMILAILKRISDDDITFMGLSPVWSRPEWMICQVLIVPPPAVRPSIKHDSQQRSEDDLSHMLLQILKTNKLLQEAIQDTSETKKHIIDSISATLQLLIGSIVDNKIPGTAPITQRSGRPLKSIKDRINKKTGRMRANLMAKRVNYSARSVITADPNISIRELGIPMQIAKNITVPVRVNYRNKAFLLKLVHNGPDNYPGAKIWEKTNGDKITLRYIDRQSIVLSDGDVVHRHMMNGDAILFNRQPTLHRMSMMCHIARIMEYGDTFRMNVADTKPYNADFDKLSVENMGR